MGAGPWRARESATGDRSSHPIVGVQHAAVYNVFEYDFAWDELKYNDAVQPAWAMRAVRMHMRD